MLTGIHIGTWGADIDSSLGTLVERLVRMVPGARFRLSSVEATEVDDRLRELFAEPAHLAFYDCIYRQAAGGWLYASEQAIFDEVSPLEEGWVERVAAELGRVAAPASGGEVFSPFGLGHHVDHQLIRRAAERWSARAEVHVRYYADYPYAASAPLEGFAEVALNAEARQAKFRAFRAYSSQLSTFWADEAALAKAASHWAEQVFVLLAKN